MTAQTTSRYVTRNADILQGEPIIASTRTTVRAIVGLWRLGTSPEEIPTHLPHLTLAQVFDALINNYIECNRVPLEKVDASVKATLGEP
ncbi:MAG TPA: DUF433 domain-containing protein [Crinalium sp.]|jgi:uncharacterized protein (DUF433 family)